MSEARSAGGIYFKPRREVKKPRDHVPTRAEVRDWNHKISQRFREQSCRSRKLRRVLLSEIDAALAGHADNLDLVELTERAQQLEAIAPLDPTEKREARLRWMAKMLLALTMMARWERVSLSVVGERAFESLQN